MAQYSDDTQKIWALADLHLSFGTPGKEMDIFGEKWVNHPKKIEQQWRKSISDDDLVLLAGDISWGKKLEDAIPDLLWIDSLPGTKVMIRGNHDYWWSSIKKMRDILPPSIHAIQNDVFVWQDVEIGGARLWDTPEYEFGPYIPMKENPKENLTEQMSDVENEKIFERELLRLELSLKEFSPEAKRRIVMTHYPPIGANLQDSRAHEILKRFHVDYCVFGHLHNVIDRSLPFGERDGVKYFLTACDYLDFNPLQIL